MVERERRRAKIVKKYAATRAQLKETIRNPRTSPEGRETAQAKLQAMPRDASPSRHQTILFQLIQKTFCGHQIGSIESFGKAIIYRPQEAPCLTTATLASPQMSEACCRSQLPSQSRLLPRKIY